MRFEAVKKSHWGALRRVGIYQMSAFKLSLKTPRNSVVFRGATPFILAGLLAGCTTGSVSDTLTPTSQMRQEPPASIGTETALAPQNPVPAGPEAALARTANQTGTAQPVAPDAGAQQASLGEKLSPVSFLPVTGAPQSAVTNLASSMRQAAQREKVPVVVSLEQGAKYQVKGYFSALNDGNGTILVYVWDILDQNGVRVHRISGQERGGGSTGDPWSGINADIYSRVAEATMSSLRTWMSTRGAG
jgi:hypothetical protein